MIRVLICCALAACATDELTAEDEAALGRDIDPTVDDLPALEQTAEAYSLWVPLSNWQYPGKTLSIRYCKTATRVYWQWTGNTAFTVAETSGTHFGPLSSNISGQYSGSKYRTHNGAFQIYFRFTGPNGMPSLWNAFSVTGMPAC